MENKISPLTLITIFYIFGLCAFYADCHAVFACILALFLIFLCINSKLKPLLCVILNLIFIFGFYNAKFHNKESDALSHINATNNAVVIGRVYSIPNVVKEKKTSKFFLGCYNVKIFEDNFSPKGAKILVSISDDNEEYNNVKIGDIVKLEGNLRTPSNASNPSEFDYKKYLKNKDTFVILYSNNKPFETLSHPDIKNAKNKPKEIWWKILQELDLAREKIILKHKKYIKSPKLEVLGGIVFGDDAVNPPDSVKQSFINSGLLHLLAASGLNVALIFSIWWVLSGFLNLPYNMRQIIGIGIIVLYTFMTGFPPSILRASIMLIIILIGKLMFKAADNFVLIFFTGFIMLLFNPKLLNDVSFELSFLVTGGLITCIEPVCNKIKHFDKAYKKYFYKKFVSSEAGFWADFWGTKLILAFFFIFSPISILAMVLVPLTAQLWAAPLQAYYFNTFTPFSVLANIAVLPFIGIISFLGFTSSTLGALPFLGDFIIKFSSYILNPLITALLNISDFFSKLPYSVIKTPSGQVFQIIIYYAAILAFIKCLEFNFKKKRTVFIFFALLLTLLGSILFNTAENLLNKNYEIIAFSVGNADNFLIKTPKNKYIMIDTAKLPYRGVSGAKRVTLEYLYDKNIRTLEALIITHFDSDHSGGAIDILQNIKVKNVYVQRNTCDTINSCSIFDYMMKNGIKYSVAKNNETIYKEPSLEVKTFIPNGSKINKEDDNENSIITYADYRGNTALFMGDGGIKEFNLIKKDIKPDIDILKVGHHGAKGVINKEMAEYLKPKYSIISTGLNHYGHPDLGTLKILENSKSKIYSTKDNGAVKFSVDKTGKIKVYTYFSKDKKHKFY